MTLSLVWADSQYKLSVRAADEYLKVSQLVVQIILGSSVVLLIRLSVGIVSVNRVNPFISQIPWCALTQMLLCELLDLAWLMKNKFILQGANQG